MTNPKSLLITGSSSGIGYDAARTMAARGWQVFATCRKEGDCRRLRGEGHESFRLDHTDSASMDRALELALAQSGGRLDAVFINGAFGLPGAIEDLSTQGLRELFEANFFGYHALIRRVVPVMRAQGDGRIVLNSSILGYTAYKFRGAYTAAKYALEGYADTLRVEMADSAIRIVLIEPGPIRTKIRENAVPHFEKWVNWRDSPRRAEYENGLLERLYAERLAPDPFERPPAAVTKKLIHALEAAHPRARYRVTVPAHAAALGKRFLPARAMDWIIRKS